MKLAHPIDHSRWRALLGAAVLSLVAITSAHATDIRHWKRTPIDIKLPVGTERIVVFGRTVRVGLPPKIADAEVLRVQSTGGAVYLKAKQPFDTQRVQIQDMQTGQILLFDLSGVTQASHETVKIEIDSDQTPEGMASSGSDSQSASQPQHKPVPAEAFPGGQSRAGAPIPVALVRHAAQALYAPQRIANGSGRIHRIAVSRRGLSGLLPAYPVVATPLAAWRDAPYTVTAIEITNRDPNRQFHLDPRNLAGAFYAASFMHDTVGPAGTLADTTTLFAVTKNGALSDALTSPSGDRATEADDAQ
jgi:integrating conjugative element protein (TIGR03749 family)